MSWTQNSLGPTTLTGSGTEDVLVAGATTNATYVFKADLTNMVNGDIIECRIYTKALTGSTLHLAWKGAWSNAQINPIKISPPIASDFSVKVTMTQQAGTGRAVDWALLRA
jgi:hypothetical protein